MTKRECGSSLCNKGIRVLYLLISFRTVYIAQKEDLHHSPFKRKVDNAGTVSLCPDKGLSIKNESEHDEHCMHVNIIVTAYDCTYLKIAC